MATSDNAAGTTARASAELQQALANISLPAIRQALGQWTADLGTPGSEPADVKKAFGDTRNQLNADFQQAKAQSAAYLQQQAKQSGMLYNPQAVNEQVGVLGRSLATGEAQQLRALNFQEAQLGMNQTNSLLSNITGTAGNVLGGAFRFGGNALQSDQLLQQYQQQAQQQNATYGALGGTILGGILGSIIPGIGTAAGAAAGGALGGAAGGYFSSGG